MKRIDLHSIVIVGIALLLLITSGGCAANAAVTPVSPTTNPSAPAVNTTAATATAAARVVFDGAVGAVEVLHSAGILSDQNYALALDAENAAQLPLHLMENYMSGAPVDWAQASKDFWAAVAPLLEMRHTGNVAKVQRQLRALHRPG